MKKKIALIGPCFPYRGGNALFMTHVFHALEERFEVKMFNYSLLYPSLLFPGTSQYDLSKKAINPVPSVRVVNSINPFSWIRTARYIKVFNPDLVVFDWWNPFFGPSHYGICLALGSGFSKKILFITENVISHEGRFIDRFLTKIGLKRASAFLSLSSVVAKDLGSLKKKRKVYQSELPVYDCYGMNHPDEFVVQSPGEHLTMLFFGYIRRYKGLDVLLKSMPLILERAPDSKLLIVGESYDDPNQYASLIADLGLSDSVTMVDRFIPNEEVGDYYAKADLVILPYREATQSGILNIAYGFEKPVLVTNVGGLAEFVDEEKTGLIVEPESPHALAEGVFRFLKLRETVDFRNNIKARIQTNQFNRIAELFETIIGETTA